MLETVILRYSADSAIVRHPEWVMGDVAVVWDRRITECGAR